MLSNNKNKIYADSGLKSYFANIYQYVALNLFLSGAVAFYVASLPSSVLARLFNSPAGLAIAFAPIGVAMYLSSQIEHISIRTAQLLYWVYGALIGVSLSSVFLIYTSESIARAFIMSGAAFGAAALYGRFTSTDLSSTRSILIIGLWAVIGLSLVNLFIGSSAIEFFVSIATVLIFLGLVASDMQNLLSIYYSKSSQDMIEKFSILGALQLFISFINIFISILRLFGKRRD